MGISVAGSTQQHVCVWSYSAPKTFSLPKTGCSEEISESLPSTGFFFPPSSFQAQAVAKPQQTGTSTLLCPGCLSSLKWQLSLTIPFSNYHRELNTFSISILIRELEREGLNGWILLVVSLWCCWSHRLTSGDPLISGLCVFLVLTSVRVRFNLKSLCTKAQQESLMKW